MTARLHARCAHRIGPHGLPGLGLGHRGGGADHKAACGVQTLYLGAAQNAEGEAGHRRFLRQQGLELGAEILAPLRGHAGREAEFGIERRQSFHGLLHLGWRG
ncbi:hypothetical protein SDC9_141309 [bioreactor metagenome]|uniref:Uncharacterized protein n=1 Tax=bioreactor metagenome TaxID=1076179 RepID=A0A645DXA7_9ZZZZ